MTTLSVTPSVGRFRKVPVDMVLTHPANPNRVPQRTVDRIRRHIKETGRYPVLIVRSLEESVKFKAEHEQGKLQLLDGEHRLKICRDLGLGEVDVDVWSGVTDVRAEMYLATLNDRGKDDPVRRARLITGILRQMEEDAEVLAPYLPESPEDIKKLVGLSEKETKLVSFQAADGGGGRKPKKEFGHPFETFLPDRPSHQKLRSQIEDWLAVHDPERKLTFREGTALLHLTGVLP